MGYKVLKGGTVITFDDATQRIKVVRNASVVIKDDLITAIATDDDEIAVPEDAEVVNVKDKIVSPGFVNTHVHIWQSVFRTLGPNVTLAQYLGGWKNKFGEALVAADDVYISCLEGYLEGLHGGVTSYLDHAHNNWSRQVAEAGFNAATDSGARVWWCYDVADRDKFPLKDQWEVLANVASKATASSLVQPGMCFDSLALPSTNGGQNHVEFTRHMVQKLNLKAITMHHLGGPWPTGEAVSPGYVSKLNIHNESLPIIFSHSPFLTDEEQKVLRKHNLFVSITPESEFHYGHGQTTGHLVCDQAALGIDTNWTFSGDILSQARLWLQNVRLTKYHKTLKNGLLPKETPFTVEQGFLMATRQGGLALKRRDIGVLQVGAKADIVVFNGDSPNMLGWSDPVAAVMLHANPGDIQHVLVDGVFRKRDYQLVNLKYEWKQVKERFLECSRRIQPHVAIPPPLPEKMFGVGEMGDVEIASTIRS